MSRYRKFDVRWLFGGITIVVIVGLFIFIAFSKQGSFSAKVESLTAAEVGKELNNAQEVDSTVRSENATDTSIDIKSVAIDDEASAKSLGTDSDAGKETAVVVDKEDTMTEALLLMEEEAYEEAVPVLLSITENEPDHAEAYAWLAASYGSLIDEAGFMQKLKYNNLMEEALNAAENLDPDSTIVHMVRGNRYLSAPSQFGGDVEKAIEDFIYCIEHGRDDADIYFSLGQAYEKIGKKGMAVEAYQNALKQNPEHVEASAQLTKLDA